MLYQIKSYIKFWIRSSNQHGVHSPFVYNLITKCFYSKKKHNNYSVLNKYKNYLRSVNKTSLNEDVFKIAKRDTVSNKKMRLLYRLSHYFKFNNSLELGTSLGIATQALHLGNKKNTITTIAACSNVSAFTKNTFKLFGITNTTVLAGNFREIIKTLSSNTYALIYFNSTNKKQETLHYFETLLATTTNNSVFIFNGIYYNKSNTEVWELIKNHPKVTVTIDSYALGFVFFRQEQAKEHFTIRV